MDKVHSPSWSNGNDPFSGGLGAAYGCPNDINFEIEEVLRASINSRFSSASDNDSADDLKSEFQDDNGEG